MCCHGAMTRCVSSHERTGDSPAVPLPEICLPLVVSQIPQVPPTARVCGKDVKL